MLVLVFGCKVMTLDGHLCHMTDLNSINERPGHGSWHRLITDFAVLTYATVIQRNNLYRLTMNDKLSSNLKSVMYVQLKSSNAAQLQTIGRGAACLQKAPATKTAGVCACTYSQFPTTYDAGNNQ